MVGAYDDGGGSANISSGSNASPNPIDKMRSAQAALDKALANPKSSLNTINKLTDKLLKTMNAAIDYNPTPTTNTNTITSTNNSSGRLNATPTPVAPALPVTKPPVKTATPDIVLFDDNLVPIETMTDLIFENIGGQELINISRNDIINGQQISYNPIKNLSKIQQQFNPQNLLSLSQTSDKYFSGFAIKLDSKIPNEGNGPNGSYVYIDSNTGNLVIEAVNLENDEQIEVQIITDGTIYEADI